MGAPMTGTFYRSPSPQDPPFVEEGQEVEAGASLGLIEVMKLFTTIEAPYAGRVVRVLAENAETVQADQPLFEIVPL
nr:acetyl-CoA carboxylase [Marivibrio halodurans]